MRAEEPVSEAHHQNQIERGRKSERRKGTPLEPWTALWTVFRPGLFAENLSGVSGKYRSQFDVAHADRTIRIVLFERIALRRRQFAEDIPHRCLRVYCLVVIHRVDR